MNKLLLALLCLLPACGVAGFIAGTTGEHQVEVWWGGPWIEPCARWGCSYPTNREGNSDTVIINREPENCGCTLVEAIYEGLE